MQPTYTLVPTKYLDEEEDLTSRTPSPPDAEKSSLRHFIYIRKKNPNSLSRSERTMSSLSLYSGNDDDYDEEIASQQHQLQADEATQQISNVRAELLRYKLSDLYRLGVGQLKSLISDQGIVFDPADIVEKGDLVRTFVNSGRVVILPEEDEEADHAAADQPARAMTVDATAADTSEHHRTPNHPHVPHVHARNANFMHSAPDPPATSMAVDTVDLNQMDHANVITNYLNDLEKQKMTEDKTENNISSELLLLEENENVINHQNIPFTSSNDDDDGDDDDVGFMDERADATMKMQTKSRPQSTTNDENDENDDKIEGKTNFVFTMLHERDDNNNNNIGRPQISNNTRPVRIDVHSMEPHIYISHNDEFSETMSHTSNSNTNSDIDIEETQAYVVPNSVIQVPTELTSKIVRAISIQPDKHNRFFSKCPSMKFLMMLTVLAIVAIITGLRISHDDSPSSKPTTSKPSKPTTSKPTTTEDVLSNVIEWSNETQILLQVEKVPGNKPYGYSTSISGSGNTLAVAGYHALFIYTDTNNQDDISNVKGNWLKVADAKQLASSTKTVGDLSWLSVTSLSADGNYLIVGDGLASGDFLRSGAVMVFSNIQNNLSVPWYQVGSTIYGEDREHLFGSFVAIANEGFRIAASTQKPAFSQFFYVYDYDKNEGDWILKMRKKFMKSQGTMAMSMDGNLLALQHTFTESVDIYNLITFSPMDFLDFSGLKGFGNAISFSHTGIILVIGSMWSNQVNVYKLDANTQKYHPLGPTITNPNVSGLGYSVSVSGDGTSFAAGALSLPYLNLEKETNKVVFKEKMEDVNHGSVHVFQVQSVQKMNDEKGSSKSNMWEKVAFFNKTSVQDIGGDLIGYSVSLSRHGHLLAFGSFDSNGGIDELEHFDKHLLASVFRSG